MEKARSGEKVSPAFHRRKELRRRASTVHGESFAQFRFFLLFPLEPEASGGAPHGASGQSPGLRLTRHDIPSPRMGKGKSPQLKELLPPKDGKQRSPKEFLFFLICRIIPSNKKKLPPFQL